MTVTDYLLMGRTPYIPYLGTESQQDIDVIGRVLADLELDDLRDRALGSLSGGELQRVVLGRALAQEAPVLLLDEPTSALDVGHQQQVLELVDSLRHDNELTVISAMHDLTLAGQFADSLVLLDAGRAVATGSAADVLTETAITRHYGASVRVIPDGNGGVLVVPTRTTRATAEVGKGA
jgi:iron complex transport system ATP-binding protein